MRGVFHSERTSNRVKCATQEGEAQKQRRRSRGGSRIFLGKEQRRKVELRAGATRPPAWDARERRVGLPEAPPLPLPSFFAVCVC